MRFSIFRCCCGDDSLDDNTQKKPKPQTTVTDHLLTHDALQPQSIQGSATENPAAAPAPISPAIAPKGTTGSPPISPLAKPAETKAPSPGKSSVHSSPGFYRGGFGDYLSGSDSAASSPDRNRTTRQPNHDGITYGTYS